MLQISVWEKRDSDLIRNPVSMLKKYRLGSGERNWFFFF
jgi:hypothetical protein